jgi:hypothetical protein
VRRMWVPLLPLVLCMATCSGDAVPVAPTDVVAHDAVAEPSGAVQASAAQSGCYAVKFNVSGTLVPGVLTVQGVVSGDLVGTVEMTFDLGTLTFAGVTIKNGGFAEWNVDGGVVAGIDEFKTSFDNKNLATDRPGSPAWVFENIGTHRALEGVQKANLHYEGISDFAEPRAFSHDYQGVICP